MNRRIKKLSALLVIQYSNLDCIDSEIPSSLCEYMKYGNTQEIFNGIDFLLKHCKESFEEIIPKNFEHILKSKEVYMKHLLSRCLKLSEGKPTFFEFLLVCVYLCKNVEYIFAEYSCFKVLKLIIVCLEAVYSRKYWIYFQENGGLLGLAKFCKPRSVKNENGKCMSLSSILETEANEKGEYFKCLNDVDGKVSLREWEKIRLVNNVFFIEKCDSNNDNDFLIECGEPEATSDCEDKEFYILPENVKRTDYCAYCRSKCFEYLDDLYRDLCKEKVSLVS